MLMAIGAHEKAKGKSTTPARPGVMLARTAALLH